MNQLYPTIKDLMLTKRFDWLTDDIRLTLWDDGPVFDPTHTVISQIGGVKLATSQPLSGRSVQDQMARSAAITFTRLTTPDDVHIALLHRETDGRLIAWLDDVSGFDFQASGGDYIFTPNGPGGAIFRL